MFIDTHAHLDQEEFDADRGEAVQRARDAGVEAILCPAVSADSSESVVRMAEEYGLFAAVGIHPNSTAEAAPGDWARIETLAGRPRVVALGETGLDRYWDHAPLAVQQDYLDRHLRLAQRHDLPVIFHCRDAAADLLPMLRAAASRGRLRGVLHAFSGFPEIAWSTAAPGRVESTGTAEGGYAPLDECVALGLYISFAGNVTYTNKKFDVLRAAAQSVPDDRLLIETDAPYLVPQFFRGKQKRNEPAWLVHTAAYLAELRGVPVEQIAALTTANARRLFARHSGDANRY